MRKPARNLFIAPPFVLPATARPPKALARLTISDLCATAGIPMRATVTDPCTVICARGKKHWRSGRTYYVGVGRTWVLTRVSALRALEVLAYGFHDYVARETVCRQGLFALPRRMGRPTQGARAMSAAERMTKMRAKLRAEAAQR